MVTSDFRPEVEIQPFRACVMHPAIIIGTVRSLWTWLWGRYHVPQNVFLVTEKTGVNVLKRQLMTFLVILTTPTLSKVIVSLSSTLCKIQPQKCLLSSGITSSSGVTPDVFRPPSRVLDNVQTAVFTFAKCAQYVEILRPVRRQTSKNQEIISTLVCFHTLCLFHYVNIQ